MTQTEIALRYTNAIVVSNINEPQSTNVSIVASFATELNQLGYMPSENLIRSLSSTPSESIIPMLQETIKVLSKLKGADVKYEPMYPNFPSQVMEASDAELFINAILHYWTFGEWSPNYDALPRPTEVEENVKFKEIGVISFDEFLNIFSQLVSSNESLSPDDKSTVEYFMDKHAAILPIPTSIDYKETMCLVAGWFLNKGVDVSRFVNTTTDVLRIATYLSDGDVSLAENTKFKSLPRRTRRALVGILDNVINEEDVSRHRNKWIKLFHNLHVGEYSKKVNNVAKKVRNNEKIKTFNGRVQAAIDKKDVIAAVNLLETRPSEYARRLDHLLRITDSNKEFVVAHFANVIDNVPTRILLQLYGAILARSTDLCDRVVFPKGNVQRAIILRNTLEALPYAIVNGIADTIEDSLKTRFGTLEDLGNVWVDPELIECPIPTQMRSASSGAFSVGRGTRLPIGDDTTLRLFIYWKGNDIDLSATLYDEDFNDVGHISYTRLRDNEGKMYHSGDITSARNGASEFIDIDIEQASKKARYVAMNVLVYSGPTFAEHETVYAGWMTRSHVNSNEIYDPKTVIQKVDLSNESKNAIPVMFDLVERKAIWVDLTTLRHSNHGGNNVESNRATIKETINAVIDTTRKVSLYELFAMHGRARGNIVETREEADTVFSIYDGDVTPYDISTINSEYVI